MSGPGTFHLTWAKLRKNAKVFGRTQIRRLKELYSVNTVKPLPWAPDYAVSDDGRVFTLRPCSWKAEGLREVKPFVNNRGYDVVRIYTGQVKPRSRLVHRLTAEVFVPRTGGNVVRHLDGNQRNNAASNLAWGTQRENMRDAAKHGTLPRGSKHPRAQVKELDVAAIRVCRALGWSTRQLATATGLPRKYVTDLIRAKNWRHVPDGRELLAKLEEVVGQLPTAGDESSRSKAHPK